jgi:Carboxylesterase family
MATLVYIHGESYEWNSGNLYDGTVLAAHSNIIVVTINFRLGVLGEFSLVFFSYLHLSVLIWVFWDYITEFNSSLHFFNKAKCYAFFS